MKLFGIRQLSVLLAGTLLLCHGVFGALHLLCYPPLCVGDAKHAAEHQQAAAVAVGDPHEHPAGHRSSTGYFAVLVVGFLGLLLRLIPKGSPLRTRLDVHWPVIHRRVLAVTRSPQTPTPLTLQVFRL